MVDPNHTRLSIVRQCRWVSIARSSFYYEGTGETPLTLRLMRLIDEQFLETPFFGSRQMTRWLRRQGDMVSRKRVRRLMREILSKVVDGVSSGGFLSDAIDEGHAIDDLDDQLSPVQCSPLFLRGQRQLEDHR